MGGSDKCSCGHERDQHQGHHSNPFNKGACGVTYCRCKGFR